MKNLFLTIAFFLASSLAAHAIPIVFGIEGRNGTEGLGLFEGIVAYDVIDETTMELAVTLKNTSPTNNGGDLTAFAFNLPQRYAFTIDDSRHPSNFQLISGNIKAEPYGNFMVGSSSTNTHKQPWLGGGNPNDGLGVGEEATFLFTFTGNFMNSTPEVFQNPGDPWFAARFRGFGNGGSDKVLGFTMFSQPIQNNPPIPAPEPGTIALLGLGLAGLGLYARRRTN